MKAIVSEKGQITIPKILRTRLGLRPGTTLDFETEGGKLVARKVESGADPVQAVTGIVPRRAEIDRYLDETRGAAE